MNAHTVRTEPTMTPEEARSYGMHEYAAQIERRAQPQAKEDAEIIADLIRVIEGKKRVQPNVL